MSKASNLHIMQVHNVNIPDFLVVTEKNLKLHEIRTFVNSFPDEVSFAVRSSVNIEDGKSTSFAGIFQTFLNIKQELVIDHVHKCIEQKYSSHVIDYCKALGITDQINMEVIIQVMIESELSGVVFTANPINGKKEIIIESIWGQGEGLVSGEIAPDQVFVDIQTGAITKYNLSHQAVQYILSKTSSGIEKSEVPILNQSRRKMNSQLMESLMNIVRNLISIFQTDRIDIEWTYANREIFILQSRPITTGI